MAVTTDTEPIILRNEGKTEPSLAKGLGIWTTGLLLVGELAGAGIVALPQAFQYLGWALGLIGLLLFALISTYMGIVLGHCWLTLQSRWPEYREHCKRPYQEIGRRAVGNWMTYVVSVTIDFTLFGTCVSYLILAAENIQIELDRWFSFDMKFCLLMIILAVALTPLMFLGSPKNFWHVIVLAMICTSIATVIMIIGMLIDHSNDDQNPTGNSTQMPNFTSTEQITTSTESEAEKVNDFFLAFGVILFAYTGHSVFPIIQQDMKNPLQWKWAVIFSYVAQLIFYIPVSALGYFVYGAALESDVIKNLKTNWCQSIVSILISFHVLFSFILMSNPVSQELEHLFNVPHRFGYKRVLVRSGLVLAILIVAESIPNFGPLLSLIGGLSSAALALIFPPIFYYLLHRQTAMAELSTSKSLPWYISAVLVCIIAIGVFGAAGSTYSSVKDLVVPSSDSKFKYPCYVSPF